MTLPKGLTAKEYIQIPGLIDLRSTFSDGELDIASLVKLAKARGFGVVFLNDHDRLAVEYGIPPFRNVFKKRVELPSINKNGPEKFLQSIQSEQRRNRDVIIIPGSETAPFYYWTGSYFGGNLTAHNHERRILTIGLDDPEDYKTLPILHNGYSTKYAKTVLPNLIIYALPFFIGLLLLRRRGSSKIFGIFVCVLSLLAMYNTNPFKSSPYDQYHGEQGIAPYQTLIDYVTSRGGLTFWNYPETHSGSQKMGPIHVKTPPYPEVLKQSHGYTGFAALYGDTITITEPGNLWDQVLLEYCMGKRERPVWGIATADFHKEKGSGEKLGNFPTVFLVRKKTKKEILFAMKEGRMYACRGKYPQRMILNDFSVCSCACEVKSYSGEEIILTGTPKIQIALSLNKPSRKKVIVRLIRSGKRIETFMGPLPMKIDYEDRHLPKGQKGYYRIDVRGIGALTSNPIFVTLPQPQKKENTGTKP